MSPSKKTEGRRVFDLISETLLENNVAHVFGLMGDSNLQWVPSYVDSGRGKYVSAVHEAGAVAMADGYARVTGHLGVSTVTHGPGITNTITALTEASRARTPLVLLTGDVPAVRGHLQYIDIPATVAPTGAGYERCQGRDSIVRDLNRALSRALGERRPIVFDVPADLLGEIGSEVAQSASYPSRGRLEPPPHGLDHAIDLLLQAKRPLVLAGHGAVLANARESIEELADALGAPLATTLRAKDFFASHARNIGVCGGVSYGVALETIRSADCIIAFGAALNRYTAHTKDHLFADKTIIHIDTDPASFGQVVPVNAPIMGDADATAREMYKQILAVMGGARGEWCEDLTASIRTEVPASTLQAPNREGTVDPHAFMIELDRILPAARSVVTDVGRFMIAPWSYLHVEDPCSFANISAFASVGLGLAAGLGVAAGRPDRPAVVVMGDGGFMMSASELSSAVRNSLPLIVVVMNDGAYGAEYSTLSTNGIDPSHSFMTWPDLAEIARAMGARAEKITTLAQLEGLSQALANPGGPIFLDVHVDPSIVPALP